MHLHTFTLLVTSTAGKKTRYKISIEFFSLDTFWACGSPYISYLLLTQDGCIGFRSQNFWTADRL